MAEIRKDPLQSYGCDPRCKCGNHPDFLEMDKAYLRGELGVQEYANRVGCTRQSVDRHIRNHLPDALLAAKNIAVVACGDTLLSQLQEARTRTLSLLDKAEDAQDTKVYGPPVGYLREIREQLKLLAELEGRIAAQPQVNIMVSAEWVEVRTQILVALDPYPEARQAVANALHK